MWFLRESLILFVCVSACFCEEKDAEPKLKRARNVRIRHNHQDPSSRPPEELAHESDSRSLFSWDILSASSSDHRVDKITNNASRNDPATPSDHSSQHRDRDAVKRRRNKRRRAKTTPETRQADATVAAPARTELDVDVDAVQRAKGQRRRERKQKGSKPQKTRKNNRKNSGEERHQRRGKKKLKDSLLIGQKIVNKTMSRNAQENEIEMKAYDENKSVEAKAETTTTTTTTTASVVVVDATEVFVREEVDNDLRVVAGGIPRNYQDILAERNRKLSAARGHNETLLGEDNAIPTHSVTTTALPDTHVTDDNVVPLLVSPTRGKSRRPCKGSRRGGCEHVCTEVEGRPVCSCYKGFRSHGNKCRDINECAADNGSCQEGCRNTLGSFHCTCPAGFRITDDDRSCRDVNECLLRNGHGPCQDRCTNTLGTYTCSCEGLPGTQLAADKHRCLDLDECLAGNGGCSHLCLNTLGNVFCLCPPGLVLGLDWKTCHDIDECLTDGEPNDICPEKCVNTIGSYHCAKHLVCGPGYVAGTSECQDIDECQDADCSQTCINTDGSYHCSCQSGFNLHADGKTCEKQIVCSEGFRLVDSKCEDVDECADSDCSQGCINTNGSYHCSCEFGFRLQDDEKTCLEIKCPAGHKFGTQECEDVDECEDSDCSQQCTNTNGSYHCSCDFGYRLQDDQKTCLKIVCPAGYKLGDYECEDINECHNHNCSQFCHNTNGSYYCSCEDDFKLQNDMRTCIRNIICPEGFKVGYMKCEDVDECEDSDCSQGCVNTNGSYHCTCEYGFRLKDDQKTCLKINCPEGYKLGASDCEDINECHHNYCSQLCTNTEGSYQCSCEYGFRLQDDQKTCLKINCPEGYKLGASDCEDINECHHNYCSQLCTNTEGSYQCSCEYGFRLQDDQKTCLKIICPEGYKLGSFDCEDINECHHNYCSQLCTNTNGSYHCSCKHGFTLQSDQTTCVRKIVCPEGFKLGRSECEDIDECRDSDCHQLCINTNGSYHCACKLGYVLKDDRKSCSQGALTAVCPPLDIPAHGYLECYRLSLRAGPWRHRVVNHSGSVCKLRCPIGFKQVGVYRRFCGQTGKWLGLSYGKCVPVPPVW